MEGLPISMPVRESLNLMYLNVKPNFVVSSHKPERPTAVPPENYLGGSNFSGILIPFSS